MINKVTQLKIKDLKAQGKSIREIADILNVPKSTISDYLKKVSEKVSQDFSETPEDVGFEIIEKSGISDDLAVLCHDHHAEYEQDRILKQQGA